MIAYVVSTLYSFWWDVVKDWGLGDPKYAFLRKQRLYSKTWVSDSISAVSLSSPRDAVSLLRIIKPRLDYAP